MRHDIIQLTNIIKNNINFTPTSFIEIGSRDGHDTSYISQFWNIDPINCYIIEAHPVCYQNIINQYPQFNTFNIAASNKTEITTFNAGIFGKEENIGISSILPRTRGEFISEIIEIDSWKMSDIMDYLKIVKFDFMKIDVEGLGLQVLQGFENKIKNTSFIQIETETEEIWLNQSCHKDIIDYLNDYGFAIFHDVALGGVQRDVLFKNNNI